LVLTSPGFYGSSGLEEDTYSLDGKKVIIKAIDQLVDEFKAESIIVVGGSHSGNIAAAVMSFYKRPIHCVIISSAPLDLQSPYRNLPFQDYNLRASEPFNPMNWTNSIAHDDERVIHFAYSKKGIVVDWRMTSIYADELIQNGHRVTKVEHIPSENIYYHDQPLWAFYTIKSCIDSWETRKAL
jgi:pimeloyl-ACP methyl ester carboxylesterase